MIELLKDIEGLSSGVRIFLGISLLAALWVLCGTLTGIHNIVTLYIKRKYPKPGEKDVDKS